MLGTSGRLPAPLSAHDQSLQSLTHDTRSTGRKLWREGRREGGREEEGQRREERKRGGGGRSE